MTVNFEYFRVFYTVAKYQNITKAAEELRLSRPTIAQELQKLEDQIGTALFDRHSRGVTFTQEGKRLFNRVGPAIQSLLDAEQEIEAIGRQRAAERINVSFVWPHTLYIFQKVFAQFNREYPHITLNTNLIPYAEVKDALRSGRTDLFFGARHDYRVDAYGQDGNPEIQEFSIGTFEDAIIVHEHLAHLADVPQRLQALAKYQFIFYRDRDTSGMEHYLNRIGQDPEQRERNLYLAEVDSIFNLLKYSDSIAIIPSFHLRGIDRDFVKLKILEPIIHTEYVVQYAGEKTLSPTARKLMDYLRQYSALGL